MPRRTIFESYPRFDKWDRPRINAGRSRLWADRGWLAEATHDPTWVGKFAWVLAGRALGTISYGVVVLGVLAFLVGPVTCFVSWFWALNLLLWAAPVHTLALIIQARAVRAIRGDYRWPGDRIALEAARIVSGLGLVLSALSLAGVACFGLWGMVWFWR